MTDVTPSAPVTKAPPISKVYSGCIDKIERRSSHSADEKKKEEGKKKAVDRANLLDNEEFKAFLLEGDKHIAKLQQDHFDIPPSDKKKIEESRLEIHYARKFWKVMKTKLINTREQS